MQAKVISIRYDAAQGAYDGRVDLSRNGRTYRYPTRIEVPESTPRDEVEAALIQRALRMSDTDRPRPAPRNSKPGFLSLLVRALSPAADPVPSGIRVRTSDSRHSRARLH